MSTCTEPGADRAGSACVTSISVLCCQLPSAGQVEHTTYPGQVTITHARLLPGCWRMSQAGGQPTAASRPCSSLTLEHSGGSKPQRPAPAVSQSEQGRAQPAHPAPALPCPGMRGGARGRWHLQAWVWAGSEALPCASQGREHSRGSFRGWEARRGERGEEREGKGIGEEGCSA